MKFSTALVTLLSVFMICLTLIVLLAPWAVAQQILTRLGVLFGLVFFVAVFLMTIQVGDRVLLAEETRKIPCMYPYVGGQLMTDFKPFLARRGETYFVAKVEGERVLLVDCLGMIGRGGWADLAAVVKHGDIEL